MSDSVPPPPDLAAQVRRRHAGSSLTLMEEMEVQFEARLKANGGQLLPLSDSVPPPPDLIEAVRLQTIRNLRAKDRR